MQGLDAIREISANTSKNGGFQCLSMGKVALVTGAAQGMGRAIAMRLASEGASVVATDINDRLVEQTSIDIRELGRESIAVEADIGDIGDINRVVDEAINAFGRIDILVNNAGVTRHADIMDLTVEDWDRIQRVNAEACSSAFSESPER